MINETAHIFCRRRQTKYRVGAVGTLGSILFHIFAEPGDSHCTDTWSGTTQARDSCEEKRDLCRCLATELSGHWQSAATFNGQRTSAVPGDMQIQFDASGSLHGTGRDAFSTGLTIVSHNGNPTYIHNI